MDPGRPVVTAATWKATVPAKSFARWDPSDLIRRVVHALDVARETVRALAGTGSARAGLARQAKGTASLLREKVVSETALLLLCVEPVRAADEGIAERLDEVAHLLLPQARHQDLLAAICLEPGLARDHAVAHILLGRLGFPDPDVDRLLAESLAMGGPDFGPERLPHRRLEQAWLARLRNEAGPTRRLEARLVADSMLGRPMDALGSTRLDVYAFTHAVMYATDLGGRRIALPRSRAAIAADADAALAFSLDANDFDLTAEVLLTWPMLGLTWSPASTFAFRVLAGVEDDRGFLPGSTFDVARHQELSGDERSSYMLATCYHTAYVMGFLCAVALRPGCAPPAAVPPARRSRGTGAAIQRLLDAGGPPPCWREPFLALARRQQDSLAPLLLTALLRRARAAGHLDLIRQALAVALVDDLIYAPAPLQAAALLRRSQALDLERDGGLGAGA
jgi:hypothetical protein